MNNYHFIVLNFVILVNYMQMKTQKMCECQNVKFHWSIYINEFWLQHLSNICENCNFNIFSQQSFVSFALYFNEFNLKLSCKFSQQCKFWYQKLFQNDEFWNFFSDVTFSSMYCLKLSNKFSQWRKFCKVKLYIDAKISKTNESKFDVLLISNVT